MKKILLVTALMIASLGAQAQVAQTVGQQTGQLDGRQQQGQLSATDVSSSSSSIAGNAGQGNGNTVVFEGTQVPTDTVSRQVLSGGTQSVLRQEFGTQKIKNTPSMGASNLTSSNDTCMGSASGAVAAPGIGVSFGKTYTDENCVRLKNARELWNMGMKGASMALMCNDAENRDALELTGFECPQTTRDRERQQQAAR